MRFCTKMIHNHVSGVERASLTGLTPTEAQALASRMLQENEAKMSTLRERRLELKRLYNGAALFNIKLPVEILVMIFRLAGPMTGPREAIRLTHICHAWRILVHNTPSYWTDFLFPPPGHHLIGNTMKHPSVVLDALARSAPMRFTFCLYGDFLPALRTPGTEAHLSRMTSMYLDCRTMVDRDMRPFFDLSLPFLESLRIRFNCSIAIRPTDMSAESPSRFPRLRALKTTCTSFPLAWVGPSLRSLDIVAVAEEAVRPRDARRLGPGWRLDPAVPTPRLNRLEEFKIGDSIKLARSLLECFPIPRETFVKICRDSAYDTLSEFLPVKNPLQALPSIHTVELSVLHPAADYPHTVQGCDLDWDAMHEEMVSTLELRASRGLHPPGYGHGRVEAFGSLKSGQVNHY
ncbi:hypothetical protein C8T65DRAFT_728518 [Cerioporus squamosus]|nr:hypothetical protein C8T65DRAFT_728518 [Cerioporus squamosus]